MTKTTCLTTRQVWLLRSRLSLGAIKHSAGLLQERTLSHYVAWLDTLEKKRRPFAQTMFESSEGRKRHIEIRSLPAVVPRVTAATVTPCVYKFNPCCRSDWSVPTIVILLEIRRPFPDYVRA